MKNNKNNAYTNKGERILIRLLCFILFGILCIPGMPLVKEIQAIQCDQVVLANYADTLTCPVCGDQNSDAAVPIKADWGNNYIAPTCAKEGSIDFVCSNHAAPVVVATVALDKIDHVWESEDPTANIPKEYPNNDATCTSNATYNYHCTVCDGYYYGGEYADTALGHNYVASVTAATCTAGGYTTHICSRCNDKYTDNETSALGHDYKDTVIKPSCTTGGYTTHACSRCSDKYTDNETSALGHNYKVTNTKAATCTEAGSETYTCLRCNDSYQKELAALGHNMPASWTVEKAATEGVDGLESRSCTRCGFKETKIIPMLPVNNNGGSSEDNTNNTNDNSNQNEETTTTVDSGDTDSESIESDNIDSGNSDSKNTESDNVDAENADSKSSENEDYEINDSSENDTPITPSNGGNVHTAVIVGASAGGLGIIFLVLSKAGIIGAKKTVVSAAGAAVSNLASAVTSSAGSLTTTTTAEVIAGESVVGAVAAKATTELLKPSFKDRAVVGSFKERDKDFVNILKTLHFIEISEAETMQDVSEDAQDQDLIILSVNSGELEDLGNILKDIDKKRKETEEDKAKEKTNIALIVEDSFANENKEHLEQLKNDSQITAFVPASENTFVKIVKLILPCLKPDLHSDEGLENIGMIADALSIPGISTLISIYTSGRDIKSTLEDADEDGLAFTDKATIISDIASILGLDTISSIAGLVEDVDDIKSTLTSDISANSAKSGKDAAEDIIDVAKNLL